jgi:hypothetical protein
MSWFSSRWVTPFVGVLLVVACLVAEPVTDASSVQRDEWASGPHAAQRSALESAQKATSVRLELKNRLLEELIAGRLTLHEVADYFTELNAECPLHAELIHRSVPGHTAEERMARNVLDHLRGFPIPPERRVAVYARLHNQFQDRFGYPVE